MNVTYHACTGTVNSEAGNNRPTYGIEMKRGGVTERIIDDIFTDAAECEAFAALCNRLELSAIHFEEVVADVVQK